MYVRRSLLSLAVVAFVTSGCFLLRPIDPSGMSPPREPERPNDPAAPQPAESFPAASEPVATTPAPEIPSPVPTPTPTDTSPAAPAPMMQPAPAMTPAPPAEPVNRMPEAAPRRTEIGPVNDATIAAMVLASNYTDISYAQLAPARAQRADVRDFAHRMLTDHTTVNQLVRDVLAKLDLAPRDNIASLDMRDESAENRDILRELSGYAFDSAYVENEVRYHQKFLASLDDIMIPRAKHAELETLLRNVRPAVAAHLAHAEQLRANVLAKR